MRYVFFDLDGTLVDTGEGIMASLRHALDAMGEPVPSTDTLRRFVGPPLTEPLMKYCGFSEARAREAIGLFRAHYASVGKNLCEPYGGICEMLDRLQDASFALAVATSKPTVFATDILERFDLSRYFLRVVGSNLDHTRSKKSEVIGFLLSALAIDDPHDVVMVGDAPQDLVGAHVCGTRGIGVTYGFGRIEELAAKPHIALLDSPAAVADFLIL